jgi:hypothetical protein
LSPVDSPELSNAKSSICKVDLGLSPVDSPELSNAKSSICKVDLGLSPVDSPELSNAKSSICKVDLGLSPVDSPELSNAKSSVCKVDLGLSPVDSPELSNAKSSVCKVDLGLSPVDSPELSNAKSSICKVGLGLSPVDSPELSNAKSSVCKVDLGLSPVDNPELSNAKSSVHKVDLGLSPVDSPELSNAKISSVHKVDLGLSPVNGPELSARVVEGEGRLTSGQFYHNNKKLRRPEGMDMSFFKAVDETISVVQNYFAPSGGKSWPSVADVVLECFIVADKVYGEDQANEFAKDFKWKESQLTEDLAAYVESGHDIGVMVSARQEMYREKRLNLKRVGRLRSDNPEIPKLIGLCEGMIVPLPPDFRANALCDKEIERLICMQRAFFAWASEKFGANAARDPSVDPCVVPYNRPLHKSYQRTYMAVDMMLSTLRDQRVAFILPRELLQQHSTLHMLQGKWVSKAGKDIGRNISDMSYGEPPYLNGEDAKKAAAVKYGAIVHLSWMI